MGKIIFCDRCDNILTAPGFLKGKFLRDKKNNLVRDEKEKVIIKCGCGYENHLSLSFFKKE